jgi:hypothetical protein
MVTDWLSTALLAAAATPMPVHVENFPAPDRVATDTLYWAQLTFWATAVIGIPALVFAFVDYLLNRRQFRRPKLSVSMRDRNRAPSRMTTTSRGGDGKDFWFTIALQLNNDGQRAATGCDVSVYVPRNITLGDTASNWTIGGDFPLPSMGIKYNRAEVFISQPVFVDHPVFIPPLTGYSPMGQVDFDIRWQVFDESGMSPKRSEPGFIPTGVD